MKIVKTTYNALPHRLIPITGDMHMRLVVTTPHKGDVVFVVGKADAWIFDENEKLHQSINASDWIFGNEILENVVDELDKLARESMHYVFNNWKDSVEKNLKT